MNNKKTELAVAFEDKVFKRESGVNKNEYTEYNFGDHYWTNNSLPLYDDLSSLITYCVKVNGLYWIRSKPDDDWSVMKTEIDARREAHNKWLGMTLPSGIVVDQTIIETYFTGIMTNTVTVGNKSISEKINIGSCPMIDNAFSIPMGPTYITYNGHRYLNKWADNALTGNKEHLQLGKLILLMIYRSLCDGERLHDDASIEADMLLKQVADNEWTNLDFRFVMNWLAAIVQKPGINLVTNLWFCGGQHGVGKGTLVDVMKFILGHTACGAVSVAELERGWNDHLVGKQLVNINEFRVSQKFSKKGWDNWIKENTCETTLEINQRNTTAWTTINIGNYLMTTNDEEPIWLDRSDRRNQLVKTSDHPDAVSLAAAIKTKYVDVQPTNIASGFAWILERVTVDYRFIARANVNAFKASIIETSQNEAEEWVRADMLVTRNKALSARDLYIAYKEWSRVSRPNKEMLTETAWGRLMAKGTSFGVIKERKNDGNYYTIGEAQVRAAPNMQVGADVVTQIVGEVTVIDNFDVALDETNNYKLTDLQRMRAHLVALESREKANSIGRVGFDE